MSRRQNLFLKRNLPIGDLFALVGIGDMQGILVKGDGGIGKFILGAPAFFQHKGGVKGLAVVL